VAHIVVGTAGHIDHGKSTLVHALTGIDPDRLKEEKARGITIELGFAHATIDGVTVAFVDVPGHERFVRTMLAGAGGLDAVMLIVAADESVMPQTREHFDICRLLRITRGLVVLTKADLVDADTLELVRLEVRDLVAGSFMEHAPVLPVSARTGEGLAALRAALAALGAEVEHRRRDGAARLPIDRAFSMQGFGTVVTGTLVSGRIRVEDELWLVPGDQRVRVRGLQVHGRRAHEAVTGQRTAINLGGIDVAQVHRGQSLVAPQAVTVTRRVDVWLELLPGAKPLKHGARVHVHQGTMEALGRVSLAGSATELAAGAAAPARLRLESPLALTRSDRFILRAYSPTVTIGGGEVLDPDPPRHGVRTAAGLARLEVLASSASPDAEADALCRMIVDAGGQGLPLTALVARAGVPPGQLEARLPALVARGAIRTADRLVAGDVVADLSKRLLVVVSDFHKAQPLADGIPREEARERVFGQAHPDVFALVLDELGRCGRLMVRERLALPGHRLDLSPEEQRVRDGLDAAYKRAGMKPPDAASLATEARWPPALVEKMTSLLLRQKRLVRVDTLIFHAETLSALKDETRALKAVAPDGRATVDVATFKDRYGVTRKYAIPLLEWLDRERVTKRVGEARVVL
jgi:selenocysteine-specific elongation factor